MTAGIIALCVVFGSLFSIPAIEAKRRFIGAL